MTHSQYLLPGLPDLLKSHRLSYKKFLHNGIDEEFDLLSAKTELNEEEIFYEGLKLNHIDELSPSHVESLDYIYHAEEKIFLIPKRTLEDSLRGRQSHSFHLFIPLEVKILPFQDELDAVATNFVGSSRPHEVRFPCGSANEIDTDKVGYEMPTLLAPGKKSRPAVGTREHPTKWARSRTGKDSSPSPVHRPHSNSQLFFRGGSGSPLSEIRKEFFQTALTFFFQQPKIQKLVITKRFLLLRWFCEKLQYIDPCFANNPQEKFIQANFIGLNKPTSPAAAHEADSTDEFELIFAKFDLETKTKLYQIYQNILLKFEKQTKKRLAPRETGLGNSSQKFSLKHSLVALKPGSKSPLQQPIKLAGQQHSKLFQKTSRWGELFSQLSLLLPHEMDQHKLGQHKVGQGKVVNLAQNRYPKFPHLPVQTSETFFRAKNFLHSNLKSNFDPFEKNSPSPFHGVLSQEIGRRSGQSSLKLPGFHFKTTGLTAGRTSIRANRNGFHGSADQRVNTSGNNSPAHGVASNQQSWLAQFGERSSSFLRFGKVENTKLKGNQSFAKRSHRSTRVVQRLTFIKRIVQARGMKNQKKKLHEIFLAVFPVIPEKKGLRFWKVGNFERSLPVSRVQAGGQPISLAAASPEPISWASGVLLTDNQTLETGPLRGQHSRPTAQRHRRVVPDPRSGLLTAANEVSACKKPKFLKHFKTTVQQNMKWDRDFHFLSAKNLQKILKPVPNEFTSLQSLLGSKGSTAPHETGLLPSKFLSLPQNEMGSLWKILPKLTFEQKHQKDSQAPSSPVSFQRYQLHKLAYRQRNMFLLHANRASRSGVTGSLAAVGTINNQTSLNALGNIDSRKTSSNRVIKGRTKLAMKEISPRVKKSQSTAQSGPQRTSLPTRKGSEQPTKLAGVGMNSQRAHFVGTNSGGKGKSLVALSRLGGSTGLFAYEMGKSTFRKKFTFDRFFLKSKERRGLHLKKTLKLREKVALRIEKKSSKLRLLPGLELWEKSHSEKRVEEYWESLLQLYRRKIPSKLLVSLPSGEIIFVKSEKDSRAKGLNISGEFGQDPPNEIGQPTMPTSLASARALDKVSWKEPTSAPQVGTARSAVGWAAANEVGFCQPTPEPKGRSKQAVTKLAGRSRGAQPTKLNTTASLRKSAQRSTKIRGVPILESVSRVRRPYSSVPGAHTPLEPNFVRSWNHTKFGRLPCCSKKRFDSQNQMLWVLELTNMKFFMKKILTYSPVMLKFFWKYRLRFLWKTLSEPINSRKVESTGANSRNPLRGFGERENLPKVCSDLRKLLSTFHEVMLRKNTEPQKFFVSGQVGKKEWPFQKDGSKSYFALLNLGKMPFMTKQGHFLINGSPRVLVSQIAKCPNFYTKMKIDSRGRPRYWTEFVSSFKNAGEWIQFHIDLENKMFFSLGTKRKYSIFIFLGALGISPAEIPDVIEHWDFLKQSIHKEEILIDKNENFLTYLVEPLEVREARILFHDTQNYSFFPGGEKTDEELQKFFEDIFYNPSRYFLGHAGREALNQRRRFSGTPSRSRALEKEDFLAAINALIEVRLGLAPPDDIDHLKFRRVRLPGELLQNEFHLALDEIFTLDFTKFREGPLAGDALESHPKDQRRTIFPTLYELEQKIFEKGRPFAVSKTVGIQSTYQVSPLEKRMRNFFHTGQLSQYMDQTNPLAEITHKRRLTSLGPDGLPKQVGVAVRELHPSHFGRICPIETPEGLNAGLVASLSSQAKIGSHHTLLAPYYWVKDRTREFPQKIFDNQIFAGAVVPSSHPTKLAPENPLQVLKYPPLLPEVIFLSASAEDSVYICSEDYWFSSKYKNFETIADSKQDSTSLVADESSARTVLDQPMDLFHGFKVDSKNALVKFQTVFPARYQQEFFTVTKSQIDFFAICPTQMISVGTSLIPFLEHDDANRALMGSNMQRQALPLLVLERPLVGTGSEKGVAQSSNSVLLSEFSGQVSFADGRKIVVDSFPKKVTSFPEPFTTKNSRLLLGSSDFSRTRVSNEVGSAGSQSPTSLDEPTSAALDFGRRNLFQKFQNRTEDGKVKTISRIFTVKLKMKMAANEVGFVGTAKKPKGQPTSLAGPTKWAITAVKVFPISDEEYEKSRNFLRREFLKKYKEIQNKKVFPVDFWPGERWKKTGDIWKLVPQKLAKTKAGTALRAVPSNEGSTKPVLRVQEQPTSLAAANEMGYMSSSRRGLPLGSPRAEEIKRIRYKKANLTVRLTQKRIARVTALRAVPAGTRFGTPEWAGQHEVPFQWGAEVGLSWNKTGRISSRVRKLSQNIVQQRTKLGTMSHFILKKKTLRRSFLPLKAGGLFFEPTPQMIFKNILSKNSKKREILRKDFLQKSFIPQRLEFQENDEQLDPRAAQPTAPEPHLVRSAGTAFRAVSRNHEPTSWAPNGSSAVPDPRSGFGLAVGSSWQLDAPRAGISRSKVSWSVSMKKVTPYTQVTYNIHGYWRTNQNTLRRQRPAVHAGDWVAAGDLLADSSATLRGELCVGQNILVGYVPWEGYNFEDAIVVNERLVEEDIYTSILIDRYEMEAAIDAGEKITRKIPDIKPHLLKNLDLRGIICVGTWVEEDDILVGKILPVTTELQGYSKLLADIYQIAPPVAKDVSFRVPDRVSGRVLECSVSEMIVRTPDNKSFATPWKVTLYLVEKRRMKLGDKMSGRHGNKGIVSIILPPQDMPFLPDGTPLDVALNPLGVPSRMNVGQLLESLLGLAGKHLHQKYRIPAFDEMYGEEFSRRIVYDKLLEASQKTQKPWLFNPNFPGKMMLRDGRTGEYFHQPILVGYPYMLKLIHMVDDKMHARATGPYTMVTQQPLKGRANRGGQRIGEMEVWAVEAFAASYALQELLTLKSDDITGRNHFLMSFLKRKKRTVGGIPDAFRVLMHELQSLCFHVHYTEDYRLTYPTLLESSNIPETPIPGNYGRGA